jgi:hypothetical protein
MFFNLAKCHLMNVYTGNVFVSNNTFVIPNKILAFIPDNFILHSKKNYSINVLL